MGQVYYRTNRQQLIAQQIINLTISLTRIRQALWTLRFLKVNKVSQINKCIQVAFICKQYRLDKILRKTIAFSSHMHQVLKGHLVVNKMQNRPGIIRRASTMLCLTDMLKIKTDICKFNSSNKIEMEVH